jgi:hypothetical protein
MKDLFNWYATSGEVLHKQDIRSIIMLRVTIAEFEILKSQITTSRWGGRRKLPFAFTEHRVLKLSSVFNSDLAIKVNIQIMCVYTKKRSMLATQKTLCLNLRSWKRNWPITIRVSGWSGSI